MGKSILRQRICKTCGREFAGGPRAWYCPDCRAERVREQNRRAKAKKRAGKNIVIGMTIKRCEVCGEPFIVTGSMQKYCKKCAADAIKEADRIQSRGWMQRAAEKYGQDYIANRNVKKRRPKQVKICIICKKSFVAEQKTSKACSPECKKIYSRFLASKSTDINEWLKRRHDRQLNRTPGVSFHKSTGKWEAYYKQRYIGVFACKADAIAARKTAESRQD